MNSIGIFHKSSITIALLLVISAGMLKGQTSKQYRVISTKGEEYNSVEFEFEPADSVSLTYSNSRGSDLMDYGAKYDSATAFEWNGNTFIANSILYNKYDTNNDPISGEVKQWNGSMYEQSSRQMYSYDSNGNLLSSTSQTWNALSSSWVNRRRTVNTYNPSNYLMVELHQRWVDSTSEWRSNYRLNSTYNSSGHKITQVQQNWYYRDSEWRNSYKQTFTVNSQGKPTSRLSQRWYPSTSEWRDQRRYTNTYDNEGWLISEVIEEWTDTSWVLNFRTNYIYNSRDYYYASIIDQDYDTSQNSWKNLRKQEYTFTTFNKIEQSSNFTWDGALWLPTRRSTYYYEEYSPTGIDEIDYNQLKTVVFPNPSSKEVHFQFENPGNEPIQLSVFDASGKRISHKTYTQKGKGPVKISWIAAKHQIQSGIYFYQLKVGESISSGQIVMNE